MPIGKLSLKGLGKLGGGLGSPSGTEYTPGPPPPPPAVEGVILENNTGFVLAENTDIIVTE